MDGFRFVYRDPTQQNNKSSKYIHNSAFSSFLLNNYRAKGTDVEHDMMQDKDTKVLGHVSIGWTLGEEVLFTAKPTVREATCYAQTESCLLGINKQKLAIM